MDFWLPVGTLHNLIQGPLNQEEDHLTVRQCFDVEHEWSAQSISFEIPDHLLNVIKLPLCLLTKM